MVHKEKKKKAADPHKCRLARWAITQPKTTLDSTLTGDYKASFAGRSHYYISARNMPLSAKAYSVLKCGVTIVPSRDANDYTIAAEDSEPQVRVRCTAVQPAPSAFLSLTSMIEKFKVPVTTNT